MAAWIKTGGVWTRAKDIRNKQAGSWTPSAKAVYYKANGTWSMVHNNEIPPLDNVFLDVVNEAGTKGTVASRWRFMRVRARLTDTSDNPDLKLIRVLASTNGFQSGPNGQGYQSEKVDGQPWSDFDFTTNDSSVDLLKNYPPNSSQDGGDVMPAGRVVYFTAFAQDVRGNWGAPVTRQLTVGNDFSESGKRFFEARFTPQGISTLHAAPVGSESPWTTNTLDTGFGYNNDKTNTFFFYGGDIIQALGEVGTPAAAQMQIYLRRSATDAGPAGAADVYLGVHNFGYTDDNLTNLTRVNDTDTRYLGTLLKGEGKWFNVGQGTMDLLVTSPNRGVYTVVPTAYVDTPLTSKYSLAKPEFVPNQGEISLTWTET